MEIHVEVTGWNPEDESVEGDGRGITEDAAIRDACQKWDIVEIGDVRILETKG